MNENIDLTKILDGCPVGTKFYSSIFDEVVFLRIDRENPSYPILIKVSFEPKWRNLTKQGKFYAAVGECTLFPSKDQRDWSKFVRFWENPKVEKFDPRTLHPFDKVLVRDINTSDWHVDFFGNFNNQGEFICIGGCHWAMGIPYNENTKYLVGTTDDCPKYYKWWEE